MSVDCTPGHYYWTKNPYATAVKYPITAVNS